MQRELYSPMVQSHRDGKSATPGLQEQTGILLLESGHYYINLARKKKTKAEWLMAIQQCGAKAVTCRLTRQFTGNAPLLIYFQKKKSKCVGSWVYTPRPATFKGENE